MSDNLNFEEIFPQVATWQGTVSYSIFSIYAVNPEPFLYYLGVDPGPFLFSNMLYGHGVHIYSRPVMKKLKTSFRAVYSIYGSYVFNFSSLLIFFALGETFSDRPVLASIVSYFTGKIMYSLFHSYLYFVDKCADSTSRTDSVLDFIFRDTPA